MYTDVIFDLRINHNRHDEEHVVMHAPELSSGYDLLLLRTEYEALSANNQPVNPPGSRLNVPPGGQKWSEGIPSYFPRFSELEKLETVPEF